MSVKNLENKLRKLTWNDLKDWAGNKILKRGENYFNNGMVTNLRITPKGILACVSGSDDYLTIVNIREGSGKDIISSDCTCPYGINCKHAVAAILAYSQAIKDNKKVSTAESSDPDIKRIETGASRYDEVDKEYEDDDTFLASPIKLKKSPISLSSDKEVADFLDGQTISTLKELLIKLSNNYPEVRTALLDKARLATGDAKKIVNSMHREIAKITSEPTWYNHWSNEGSLADFSRVNSTMSNLYAQGQYDAVIKIAKELLRISNSYIETCNDDGDLANQISECIEIGFKAVKKSGWSNFQKIMFVLEAELEDEYDICSGANEIFESIPDVPTWSNVANELFNRLSKLPSSTDQTNEFSLNYKRNRLSNFLISALEKSGRDKEILPLCKREARITASWERYVDRLIESRKYAKARRAAEEGIKQIGKEYPGIVKSLKEKIAELAKSSGDYDMILLLRQEEFLNYPCLENYDKLIKATIHTKNTKEIKSWALKFLETGKLVAVDTIKNSLMLKENRYKDFPQYHVLIDIAEKEKNVDKVLFWYRQAIKKNEMFSQGYSQVASAITEKYPDEALKIWRKLAENQIALAKPSAYETAVEYLGKVRDIYLKTKRQKEWECYLANLRETNKKKTRFLKSLLYLTNEKLIHT